MKLFISLICIAALGVLGLMLTGMARPGDLLRLEYLLPLVAVAAVLARGWQHMRRRERQRIEAMRDSALW